MNIMQKCLITCGFLASGDSYVTLKTQFRMVLSTVHDIIRDTCRAIWITFKKEVMPDSTVERWQEIEKGFRVHWNFPNCLGALDGKHINIIAPANSASTFHNYKGHFSTVLMALLMPTIVLFMLTLVNMEVTLMAMCSNILNLG